MTGAPIGVTAAWLAAAEAADGQCEHTGKAGRCTRTLRGRFRLYLGPDRHIYCEDHVPPAPAAPQASTEVHQDALF